MILETIREELNNSKVSRYRIARDTGLAESQLSRLMQGRDVSCRTADILLRYFHYTIIKADRGNI